MAKKQKLMTVAGKEDFAAKADEWARLDNEVTRMEAKLGAEQDALLRKYEDLTELKEKRQLIVASLEAFAVKSDVNEKAVCFAGKRSGASTLAEWGLALNPPALETLKGFTWAAVQTLVLSNKTLKDCVKMTPKLDKETLKARIGDKPDMLAELGLKVEQGTTFAIARKADAFETV